MKFSWPSRKTWLRIGAASVLKSILILALVLATSAHAGTPLHVLDSQNQLIGTYQVEIARTEAQREKGLMHRKSLAEGSGMIFLFDPPLPGAKFWMKNTLIPLDMLFADSEGQILYIQRNAKPGDLTSVGPASTVLVASVLELNAGAADAAGIKIGDRLAFPGATR